jgi:hypothetical protein
MALETSSVVNAIGTFNGIAATPVALMSRGFGAITRTSAIAVGSYDIAIDNNTATQLSSAENAIQVTVQGVSPAFNLGQYSIIDANTLRVQCINAAGAGAFVDANFSVVILRIG